MFRGNATFSDTIYVICWFDVPVSHDPAFSEHVFGARLSHGQTGSGEIAVRRRPTQRKRAKTPKKTPLPSRNSLNFALDISFTSSCEFSTYTMMKIRYKMSMLLPGCFWILVLLCNGCCHMQICSFTPKAILLEQGAVRQREQMLRKI